MKKINISKDSIINFTVIFVFSLLVYSQLMAHNLVNNYDGLWEVSFHNAGAWELSLGRWFWLYLSRLRFGIAPDPITSIISLLIFSIGLIVFFDTLNIGKRFTIYLSSAMFVCSPVVCISLSYRYMSPTFATAFLLSVLAVWFTKKLSKTWLAVSACAISVMLSMGAYQAYISCTCVILLAVLIKELMTQKELKPTLIWFGKAAMGVVTGGILYIIALKVHQTIFHVAMSDYMGGSSYSLINSVKNIGSSFKGVFQILSLISQSRLYKLNILQNIYINGFVLGILLIALIVKLIKLFKENYVKGIIALIAVILIPFSTFAIKYIATDAAISLQMFGGWFLLFPAVYCVISDENECAQRIPVKIAGIAMSILLCVYAYGGLYQVVADQNMMYEGQTSAVSIAELALDKIEQLDYLDSNYTYCFYGTPAGSALFNLDSSVQYANMYALFGAWYANDQSAKSWRGLVNDIMGLRLNMASQYEYSLIQGNEEVNEMPAFPAPGSIKKFDNIVVVKIS